MADVTCPACGLKWEENCEQHVCIQLFGECMACRFMPDGKGSRSGTQADMDRIITGRRIGLRLYEFPITPEVAKMIEEDKEPAARCGYCAQDVVPGSECTSSEVPSLTSERIDRLFQKACGETGHRHNDTPALVNVFARLVEAEVRSTPVAPCVPRCLIHKLEPTPAGAAPLPKWVYDQLPPALLAKGDAVLCWVNEGALYVAGVMASSEARPCRYTGGTCTRRSCVGGICQAMVLADDLRERTAGGNS